MSTPTEVRRCHACGQPKVLLEANWRHTNWGMETSESTREYRCQGCGARFTIHSRMRQIALWVVGALFVCPSGIGLGILALAWWRGQQDARNPVVPGAAVPEIRYRMGAPLRRCAQCAGTCVATHVTAHRTNGIPMGVEMRYQCRRCGHAFTVESVWGTSSSGCSALLILAIGAACAGAGESAAMRWGGGGLALVFGLFMVWSTFRSIRDNFANPVDDQRLE